MLHGAPGFFEQIRFRINATGMTIFLELDQVDYRYEGTKKIK
jgi:hypothetical protein